ncbi:MAG: RDD family protein [Campylobacterota bacterium]|nr:RDD family protein [Campylobacterota bacterium]
METENLQLASMRSRIKAFIIDDISITLVVILLLWDEVTLANGDLISILVIMNEAFLQIITLKFIYQTFFIWYYGATIGKIISKIKVIDFDNFGKVSLLNAAVRSFGRIISESFFYIGFIIAYYTDSRQTFHDKFGKTLVVDV